MSRSRKKHFITGITTCDSEKSEKVGYHRSYRHAVHDWVHITTTRLYIDTWDLEWDREDEPMQEPHFRAYSDPWKWGKDGRSGWARQTTDWRRGMK